MIRQLAVFVENRPGSLMQVTSELTEAHINIRAVASLDTPEFGILRLIVDDPDKAKEHLTAKGFVVRVHKVLGAELRDEKGNLNQMLATLADGEVNVSYIYSFVIRQNRVPVMVLQTDDYEKAEKILEQAGFRLVSEEEL